MHMRHIHSKRRKKKFGLYTKILLLIAAIITILILADKKITPVISSVAQNQAQAISTTSINKAILDELSNQNINYSDLVHIERGSDSKIISMQTNTLKVNELKSKISLAIQQSMTSNKIELKVPLGTLLGNSILRGRGPEVPVVISYSGSVNPDFKSNFTSAGINQTKHEIYVVVTADIAILMPNYDLSTQITTTIPVAENIIIGDVPKFYANLDSNSSNALNSLANQSANQSL